MDDQNNSNRPLDQGVSSGVVPPVPPVPTSNPVEDITPATEPVMSPTPEPMTPPAPAPVPEPEITPPQSKTTTTFTTTTTMPTPEPSPIPSPIPSYMPSEPTSPVAPETPMPQGKPKKKIISVIGGVLALLLVVGVAGAAYYVSNQLSTRQVAPENVAAGCSTVSAHQGQPCCVGYDMVNCVGSGSFLSCDCQKEPENPTITYRDCTWHHCVGLACMGETDFHVPSNEACTPSNCVTSADCGATTTKTCTWKECNSTAGTCQYSHSTVSILASCPTDSCGTIGNSCGTGNKTCTWNNCDTGTCKETSHVILAANTCPTSNCTIGVACNQTCSDVPLGQQCSNSAGDVCCYGGCCNDDDDNIDDVCKPAGQCGGTVPTGPTTIIPSDPTGIIPSTTTCNNVKDAPASNTLTFSKAGTVIPFLRNPGSYTGMITLTQTGSQVANMVLIQIDKNGVASELVPFPVNAGDVYTIKVELNNSNGTKTAAYGWRPNKSANICGPTNAACGGDQDITPVKTLATSKSDITGITAGAAVGNIQCWGDPASGDQTQDYDYNDFTLIFGYGSGRTEVGACTLISVYKKVDGVYGTTALTTAQLQTLKVGDVLKFALTSNIDNLKGRFRITIGSTAGEWLAGTIDATNKKLVTYSDYIVGAAGTYKFEAQVKTTPN